MSYLIWLDLCFYIVWPSWASSRQSLMISYLLRRIYSILANNCTPIMTFASNSRMHIGSTHTAIFHSLLIEITFSLIYYRTFVYFNFVVPTSYLFIWPSLPVLDTTKVLLFSIFCVTLFASPVSLYGYIATGVAPPFIWSMHLIHLFFAADNLHSWNKSVYILCLCTLCLFW